MTKKKRNIYKKKGRVIKDLNRKILKVFSTQNKTPLNYKQIAASLKIEDSDGRNQILKKLAEMQANGRIKEESRGKYILNCERSLPHWCIRCY